MVNSLYENNNNLAEISDRLIEDTTRRRHGMFYTPIPFVNYAHKMIGEELGEDWKERCVVWDNSCGSCNLTRDYKFKEFRLSFKRLQNKLIPMVYELGFLKK